MFQQFKSFIHDEQGAAAIEYGLIASSISVAIVGSLDAVGNNLAQTFQTIDNALN